TAHTRRPCAPSAPPIHQDPTSWTARAATLIRPPLPRLRGLLAARIAFALVRGGPPATACRGCRAERWRAVGRRGFAAVMVQGPGLRLCLSWRCGVVRLGPGC